MGEAHPTSVPTRPLHILLVTACPDSSDLLRVDREARAIRRAAECRGSRLRLTYLPGATIDDLRRVLLDNSFDVVHLSGHAIDGAFLFDEDGGGGRLVTAQALALLLGSHAAPCGSLRCVVLNACATTGMAETMARRVPYVVYAEGSVLDEHAIDFSLGFYDALARGRPLGVAHVEGRRAVTLRHGSSAPFHTELLEQRALRAHPRSLCIDLDTLGRWHIAIGLPSITLGRSRSTDFCLSAAPRNISRLHAELRVCHDDLRFEIAPLGDSRIELDGRTISSHTCIREGNVLALSSRPLLRAVPGPQGVLLLEALATSPHRLTYVYSALPEVQIASPPMRVSRGRTRIRVEMDELDVEVGPAQRVCHAGLTIEARG